MPIATSTQPTANPNTRPEITIISPANNAEVVLNQQLLVSVSATDSVGITRVQLLANGQIVKTVSSESATGDQTFNAVLDYTPRAEGALILQAVAYRLATASTPAQITVTVRANQQQVTATAPSAGGPVINPNDPTCRALVNIGLNLRSGPNTTYDRISVLAAGTVVPIVGRIGSNAWWQVRVNTTIGWISGDYVTIYGNCQNIPVVAAPATPTSIQPTATATLPPPTNTLTLTVVPPTATATASPVDLVVTNITGPASVMLGSGDTPVSANYSVTITNLGGTRADMFNNVITILPANTEVFLGAVGNLDPGQSILLNASVTFTSAGTFIIQATADSDNTISEITEVNNSGTVNVTISPYSAVLPPLIELPLATFQFSPSIIPTFALRP